MLSLQRTLSLGYLGQHPQRMVLVVASIALGVAVLVATRSLDDSLHQAAKGAINPFAVYADLLVANGQTGVPADLADRLKDAHIAGLADAQPLVIGRAALVELHDQAVRLIGIQLFPDEASAPDKALRGDNPWGLEYTRTDQLAGVGWALLQGAKPVVIGVKLSDRMKDLPGGTHDFHLRRLAGELQPVTSWGTVRLPGPAKVLEDDAVFADVRTAASIIYPQRQDYCTQINIKTTPGADVETVHKEVAKYLKEHHEAGEVQTVKANEDMTDAVTAKLESGFSIGGYLALMVGLFLVYNVLSVTVAERRRDIGILRSVGATRGQIAGLFVGEAAVQGLCGSLLGLPLGYGMAWGMLNPLRQTLSEMFVQLPDTPLSVSLPISLLAVSAGLATALLAALVPALQAADEQPADAVRRVPQTIRPIYVILQAGAAVALAAAGVAAFVLQPYLPPRLGLSFAVPVLFMAAALVAMPLLAQAAGRVVQPLFRHCLGLAGRLAADNLVRTPGRTGLVVAALAATGGLVLMTAGFTHSTEDAINRWLDDVIAADLYVTAGSGISQAGLSLPMDPSVGEELTSRTPAAAEIEAALPVRYHYFPYEDHFIYLLAIDSGVLHGPARDRALGGALKQWPRFREDHTCVVSDNFAVLHHVGVGGHITIPGRAAPTLDLEIIGTIPDYSSDRGTILVDRGWYSREFLDDQVDVFDVYLRPGADGRRVQEELMRSGGWASHQAVFVERRDQLRDAVANQLERLYLLAYAQEVIIGLVALLGVISALLIAVLQRQRELGLLRAVGASRGQVLRSVLAEAALMGLVGAIIGVCVGLALEWYVVRLMVFSETGFVFPMLIPWRTLAAVLGGSAAAATLAGLWPAWRATGLRIPEAIAYE